MDTSMAEKSLAFSTKITDSTSEATENISHPRPPCRGCLPDCPNYDTCDGKPWRK